MPERGLKKELEALGINTRGKVISELHAICEERSIPITTAEKDLQEGWMGKQKCIRQVAWELG
jgi:hypothetical protein